MLSAIGNLAATIADAGEAVYALSSNLREQDLDKVIWNAALPRRSRSCDPPDATATVASNSRKRSVSPPQHSQPSMRREQAHSATEERLYRAMSERDMPSVLALSREVEEERSRGRRRSKHDHRSSDDDWYDEEAAHRPRRHSLGGPASSCGGVYPRHPDSTVRAHGLPGQYGMMEPECRGVQGEMRHSFASRVEQNSETHPATASALPDEQRRVRFEQDDWRQIATQGHTEQQAHPTRNTQCHPIREPASSPTNRWSYHENMPHQVRSTSTVTHQESLVRHETWTSTEGGTIDLTMDPLMHNPLHNRGGSEALYRMLAMGMQHLVSATESSLQSPAEVQVTLLPAALRVHPPQDSAALRDAAVSEAQLLPPRDFTTADPLLASPHPRAIQTLDPVPDLQADSKIAKRQAESQRMIDEGKVVRRVGAIRVLTNTQVRQQLALRGHDANVAAIDRAALRARLVELVRAEVTEREAVQGPDSITSDSEIDRLSGLGLGRKPLNRGHQRSASSSGDTRPWESDDSDGADEMAQAADVHKVERILDMRVNSVGEREFLIKWQGWSAKWNGTYELRRSFL